MPGKNKKQRKKTKMKKKPSEASPAFVASHDPDCDNNLLRMKTELQILREVAEITNKDFDLNTVLGRFLDISMEAASADAGSMLLIDRVSNTLDFTVARGKKADRLSAYKLALGEGIAGWVAQSGKPLLTPDASKEKRLHPTISKEIDYKASNILCVPLKFEDEILGVIELLNKKGSMAFDEKDMAMVQSFTPYITMVIKNAQHFIENKRRIHRLEHLTELTRYVNSTLNLETILETILKVSTDTLNAEAGSILLLDEDKDELVFEAATGEKKEKLNGIRVPIGEGIAGWVAREAKPVLIPDAQKDPRFFKKADQKTEFKTRSIIAVPLKTKDKLIGVAEVLNKKGNEFFNIEDLDLFEALANQAAVAIENARLYTSMKELFRNTVGALAEAIETKDVYTRGHSERVTEYSDLIAKELGFSEEEIESLNLAGLLHDIGKIGVDERILRKPSKLTDAEFEEIKKHPEYAANIIKNIPQLKGIIAVVRHHHERYDGNGYPDGLKGGNIPYNARIISIADTFDAMSSKRPYRDPLPFGVCVEEIIKCSGTQFDPDIVPAAIRAFRKYFSTREGRQNLPR
jgi:HD-GYP domain-containing protein (c-di-GMP phosphodiesterase class II)